MERIGELTGGALAVNPNTMYPLLRSLEAQGLAVAASGSTPSAARGASTGSPRPGARSTSGSRRSSAPRLDRIARSIDAIRDEVLG